jgi:hypothetical protein
MSCLISNSQISNYKLIIIKDVSFIFEVIAAVPIEPIFLGLLLTTDTGDTKDAQSKAS